MSFSKPTHPAVAEYMAALGRKGGKANSNHAAGGKAVWAKMTPAQRSKEMKRRAKVRLANRAFGKRHIR